MALGAPLPVAPSTAAVVVLSAPRAASAAVTLARPPVGFRRRLARPHAAGAGDVPSRLALVSSSPRLVLHLGLMVMLHAPTPLAPRPP